MLTRVLTTALCSILLLALWAVPTFAATTDADVTVDLEEVRTVWLTVSSDPDDTQLTNVDIDVGADELDDTYVEHLCPGDYSGYLHWRTNCEWELIASLDSTAGGWDTQGLVLYLKSGGIYASWDEVTTTGFQFLSDGANYGYNDLDWKVTGLGWSTPPGTYTATVKFQMQAST